MILATDRLCALLCNNAKRSPHFSVAALFRCVAQQRGLVELPLPLCNGERGRAEFESNWRCSRGRCVFMRS